jgi:hypothetical protein
MEAVGSIAKNGRRLIAASMPSGVEHNNPEIEKHAPGKSDRRLDAFGR